MNFERENDDVMESENSYRTKRVIFRLSEDEHKKVERKWKASTCDSLSDYLRHCLFGQQVVTIYRNGSQDDYLAEMAKLRQELNAIGNNINQVVKRLHILKQLPEFRGWIMNFEVEKLTLFNKVEEIKSHVQKVSESWLQ